MFTSFRIAGCFTVAAVVCGLNATGQTSLPNGGVLAQSRVYALDTVVSRRMPNGGQVWNILQGALPKGEAVAVHESEQSAGAVPNPPHRIEHSEIIVVQQGRVAFVHDGRSEVAGPGGVIFVAYGTLHTLKNIGSGRARYTVVQIGGDTAK